MKKVLLFFSMLAIVATAVAVSCNKEAIKIDKTTLSVSHKGEEVTLKVTANGEFTSQPDEKWLKVLGSTITVEPNAYIASRSGHVTFYCGDQSATVLVNQEGRSPSGVVEIAVDAARVSDYQTFYDCLDTTEEQRAALEEVYKIKAPNLDDSDILDGFQILSETVTDSDEATVKVKYYPKGGDPTEVEWTLTRKQGKWKINYDNLLKIPK